MIDNHILSVASRRQESDCRLQQPPSALSIDRRQDHETWMQIHIAQQFAEVAAILRDDDAILFQAPGQHAMIGLASPADMAS